MEGRDFSSQKNGRVPMALCLASADPRKQQRPNCCQSTFLALASRLAYLSKANNSKSFPSGNVIMMFKRKYPGTEKEPKD